MQLGLLSTFFLMNYNRIKLIDFDWSGKVEQVRYPNYMNPSVIWPTGVESGKIIKQEHDLYWLRQLHPVQKTLCVNSFVVSNDQRIKLVFYYLTFGCLKNLSLSLNIEVNYFYFFLL